MILIEALIGTAQEQTEDYILKGAVLWTMAVSCYRTVFP